MYLSRIYLPSISLVLEAEPQHFFIPVPEASSVFVAVDDVPPSSNSYPQPDSDLLKPVNLSHEELEGDEHFSFVVQFPAGLEVPQQYDEVGRIVPQEKRPCTSRGPSSRDEKSFFPQRTHSGRKPHNIPTWRNAFRRVCPATFPTLRRRLVQH